MIVKNKVTTPCGEIQGIEMGSGITAFRGIRYATAGRWEYPRQVTKWEGVYDATHFGPNSMTAPPRSATPGFYDIEFRLGLDYTYSEDGLMLNVYAPNDAEKAPVIVYIHGGAYMGGSGWDKVFCDPHWTRKGCVAVTLNYRLGIFGSCALPEVEAEAGHTGNFNIYDQLTAMEWIHDNIAAFGGDPENITLMGQSAGARSVQMLVGSPRMKGIIKHAVMSSGGGVPNNLFQTVPTYEEVKEFWADWQASTGKNLSELRAMDAGELMGTMGMLFGKHGFQKVISFVSPCYDNADFPTPGTHPELPDGWLEIPYLCGGNTQDIVPGMDENALNWCAQRPVESFAYRFARQLPGDDQGAFHSADLWYWFGTLENCWRPWEGGDYALSNRMIGYLVNFAKTGNPNGEGLPQWNSAKEGLINLDI